MIDTKCQYCGAEIEAYFSSMNEHVYKCGSFNYSAQASRTCHCREREAHNQTKLYRDKLRELLESSKRGSASLNEALDKTLHELREAREQNAKLRDIAERALNFGEYRAPCLGYPGPTWEKLRAELDQIKRGAK